MIPPLHELLPFLIVGASAAGVNFLGVILLVEYAHLPPLLANLFAFLMAYPVSLLGHRSWTFRKQNHPQSSGYRFFCVALLSFALNELLFALLLQYFSWPYWLTLLIVLVIVAVLTFVLSKRWAFLN